MNLKSSSTGAAISGFAVRVAVVRQESRAVRSYELLAVDGTSLPAFDAGAHIEVKLGGGLVRSYSLANSPAERGRYVIAVHRELDSRGGSAWLHDRVAQGDVLTIGAPRNHFPLVESAAHSVLVAGGIGITPIRAMVLRLRSLDRPWTLHYAGRDREAMAFLAEFEDQACAGCDVRIHVDVERGHVLDLGSLVSEAPSGSHFYCCGPSSMIATFQASLAGIAPDRVHVEYFAAQAPAAGGGFRVQLARSGRCIDVVATQTLLDALIDAGVSVPYSCMDGVCGACETRVLEGVPDHRDAILTDEQRQAGDRMMVCCSGALSKTLVLDL